MERGLNFYDFSWATTMSYVSLLALVSMAMFLLVKERSFRHYFIYAIFLLLYIATKHPTLEFLFEKIIPQNEENFNGSNFNWWIQVVFYTYYTLFAYYLLDLDSIKPKVVPVIRKAIYIQLSIGTILFILGLLFNLPLLVYFFLYWFMPIMLGLMFYFIPTALRTEGPLKWVILSGILVYITAALIALFFSLNKKYGFENPIVIFFVGIIFENICFSIGIALKYKKIHEERTLKSQQIAKLEYDKKIASLRGTLHGEQKERKRIAAELHDGLGNLTATALIQFEHAKKIDSCLEQNDSYAKGIHLLENISDDVRNIAHNLMPKTLTKLGLVRAVGEIADNVEQPRISLSYDKSNYNLGENHAFILFRMIQECLNNIIKHAEATEVNISFEQDEDKLIIKIKDDGVGFDTTTESKGLGLQNLKSRAELIHGSYNVESVPSKGTISTITSPIMI